jgi:hypothetical protein
MKSKIFSLIKIFVNTFRPSIDIFHFQNKINSTQFFENYFNFLIKIVKKEEKKFNHIFLLCQS